MSEYIQNVQVKKEEEKGHVTLRIITCNLCVILLLHGLTAELHDVGVLEQVLDHVDEPRVHVRRYV